MILLVVTVNLPKDTLTGVVAFMYDVKTYVYILLIIYLLTCIRTME